MILTNNFNLPEAIVRAAQNDEYDRGDSQISVTQLISPPRIVLLQSLNESKLQQDVVDRVPSMLGTALHKILERGSPPDHIVEERFFAKVLGWKISGAVDVQIPLDGEDFGFWEINDYKVTSVYSVMQDKPEWEQQLNCYGGLAFLCKCRPIKALKIIAFLKDWSRKSAELSAAYPQAPIQTVDIPVWAFSKQINFIEERVRIHQQAKALVDKGESPPYCSDQERWIRNENFAVMKEGRKSAVKLHDTRETAEKHAEEIGARVEHRRGTAARCEGNWCLVNRWCKQFKEWEPS